eukprot:TRINITY_DN29738_c0_g2_i1.p1 TRINITY_DN29738_c0_g2~~TRINITY_DN29738_c0_g2_i1.p1  ORF type:complete len:596 (+),score=77.95 TRINITY_DN29738_c0_g2_i1:67-1788(+)
MGRPPYAPPADTAPAGAAPAAPPAAQSGGRGAGAAAARCHSSHGAVRRRWRRGGDAGLGDRGRRPYSGARSGAGAARGASLPQRQTQLPQPLRRRGLHSERGGVAMRLHAGLLVHRRLLGALPRPHLHQVRPRSRACPREVLRPCPRPPRRHAARGDGGKRLRMRMGRKPKALTTQDRLNLGSRFLNDTLACRNCTMSGRTNLSYSAFLSAPTPRSVLGPGRPPYQQGQPQPACECPEETGGCGSKEGQDLFLARLGLGRLRGGTLLELGSNHPYNDSHSWWFRRCRGWRGVCVDASPMTAALWLNGTNATDHNCDFVAGAVASVDPEALQRGQAVAAVRAGQAVMMGIPTGYMKGQRVHLGCLSGDFMCYRVQAVSTEELLEERGISHVDLLLADIEGAELGVLGAVDWTGITVDHAVIEVFASGNVANANETLRFAALRRLLRDRVGLRFVARVGYDAVFVRPGGGRLDQLPEALAAVGWGGEELPPTSAGVGDDIAEDAVLCRRRRWWQVLRPFTSATDGAEWPRNDAEWRHGWEEVHRACGQEAAAGGSPGPAGILAAAAAAAALVSRE